MTVITKRDAVVVWKRNQKTKPKGGRPVCNNLFHE